MYFNNISDLSLNDSKILKSEDVYEDWNEMDFTNRLSLTVTIVWSIIIVIGVLANGCVLVVILCKKHLTTPTQYFIFSLASSDLIFLLICPTITLVGYNYFSKLSVNFELLFCKIGFSLTHVIFYANNRLLKST